jgi:hypothetical protein
LYHLTQLGLFSVPAPLFDLLGKFSGVFSFPFSVSANFSPSSSAGGKKVYGAAVLRPLLEKERSFPEAEP